MTYRYKCDKTGLTYSYDKLVNSAENIKKINDSKFEVPCSQCGGKHLLVAEKKK